MAVAARYGRGLPEPLYAGPSPAHLRRRGALENQILAIHPLLPDRSFCLDPAARGGGRAARVATNRDRACASISGATCCGCCPAQFPRAACPRRIHPAQNPLGVLAGLGRLSSPPSVPALSRVQASFADFVYCDQSWYAVKRL